MYLSFLVPFVSSYRSTLCCLINGGVQIVGGGGKFSENLINGGVQISGGGGKLGNPYLKIRYKIMFFMYILRLVFSFSTSIQLWHTDISQITPY